MRLTLRTLLAWLDDTLSPSEVREIGRQVEESPFAKELVDKIHVVTRQRRLTVPPLKGPDAVDANVVAAYLDNELEPDKVADLEKKCLVSDVHLAEVASVHQVLSLVGQKAKVPVEARHRMYQLIKGREAVKPEADRASRQTEPRPMTEPVQPWISPPPPHRPWLEQFGPAALVAGLILVLCLTAWKTLSTPEHAGGSQQPVAVLTGPESDAAKKKAMEAVAPKEPKPEATEPAKAAGNPEMEPGEGTESPPKTETTAAEETKVPAGSVGLAKKPTGVLLRYNPGHRDWERLSAATPLREQDRLLNLEPFRNTLELGTAEVDLVSETEIWARDAPVLRGEADPGSGPSCLARHGAEPSLRDPLRRQGRQGSASTGWNHRG